MDRRAFITGMAGSLLATPLAVEAQQTKRPTRIAMLNMGGPETSGHLFEAFKQGLRDLGYIEGERLRFEVRWAMGDPKRVPGLAQELVALVPDVILVGAAVTARAAQQATTTIPIVGVAFDPVAQGLVKSLARPGGNLTGLSSANIDVSPKLLELLLSLSPKRTRVGVVLNPDNPGYAATRRNLEAAAQSAGSTLDVLDARTPTDIEDAFRHISQRGITRVIVQGDSFFFSQRQRITALALKHRMASVHLLREMVEAGGLMSYGPNTPEQFRHAASYVDKILKGAKPEELPIQQSIKLELVINMKTAKALGLTIPPSLLLRADQVIE